MKKSGFTLIEVMIALFILVIIGTATSKAVIDAAKLKEVLKDETEFASEFRTSMAFIEKDLSQVFNPRWFLSPDLRPLDPYNPAPPPPPPAAGAPALPPTLSIDEITRRTRGQGFQPTDYWGPIIDATGIRASRFKGDQNSISFVSASHVRVYQQKPESIYSKIKYELIPQPENPNLNKEQNDKFAGLHALAKIESTRAFDLEDRKDSPGRTTYVILNNIKSIKINYFKKGSKDALKEWDSESQDPKGSFPQSLTIEVSIAGPKDRSLDESVQFTLEAPNDVLPKTY